MGKIDLGKFDDKKKPVASSSGGINQGKRKRKRIKKGLSQEEIKNVGVATQKAHKDKLKARDTGRKIGGREKV
jgi:hypothetical protein